MGIKNRTGCCCGSIAANCLNLSTICRGEIPSLYLNNGKVTDDNGTWPILQPNAANPSVWQTNLIKHTTDRLTRDGCTVVTGDTYYRYVIDMLPPSFLASPSMRATIVYSTEISCEGFRLFSDQDAGNTKIAQSLFDSDFSCDPVSADYTFASTDGLDPPSKNARIEFAEDTASFGKCVCRGCSFVANGLGYPPGDASVSYSIDDGEISKSGTLTLTRVEPANILSATGVTWVGNLDWWTGHSCSNPTNAGGGHNVVLSCGGLDFLKWCKSGSGPHTKVASRVNGDIRFSLLDDSASNPSQGGVRIQDASAFDRICCGSYSLPRKDVSLNVVNNGSTVHSSTLTYHEQLQKPTGGASEGLLVSRWTSDSVSLSSEAASVVGLPGLTNPVVWFFDCNLPTITPIALNTNYEQSPTSPKFRLYGFQLSMLGESTEDPLHLAYSFVGNPNKKMYIDEVE